MEVELNLYWHYFGLGVGEADLTQSRDVEVATNEVSHTTDGRTGRSWHCPTSAVGTCPLCSHMPYLGAHSCPQLWGQEVVHPDGKVILKYCYLGHLFSLEAISRLFTVIEYVLPGMWRQIRGATQDLSEMFAGWEGEGVSCTAKCSPGEGCEGGDRLSTAVSEGGDWRRGFLACLDLHRVSYQPLKEKHPIPGSPPRKNF